MPIMSRLGIVPKRGNVPAPYASAPITRPLIAATRASRDVRYAPNLGIRLTSVGGTLPIRAKGGLPNTKRIGHPAPKVKSGLEWQKRKMT